MKLVSTRVYLGRNIYSHWPVVRIDVDLEKYVNIPTCDIEGFNEKLLTLLPGLREHKCSPGYEGGFVERLNRGTYLAHVLEHMALDIQNKLGYRVTFGKTRYLEGETIYCLVFTYEDPIAGLESGKLAFNIIDSLLNNKAIDLEQHLNGIQGLVSTSTLGPSTAAIVEEAKKRDIPVTRIGEHSLVQLGYGKYGRKVQATVTDQTSCVAVDTACDKVLTNHILRSVGIPVPFGKVVTAREHAVEVAEEIGYPVVVKPDNGNQGKGVSLELRCSEDVESAFDIARGFSDRVLLETFIPGKHYRIAVVADQVVAVSQRIQTHVVGNGYNTIRELIDIENSNPLRGEGHEKPLTKIKIDDVMMLILQKTSRTLEDVPKKEELIYLRENANLSTGGIAIDVTDEIHPDNVKVVRDAVRIIGLDIAGIDVTMPDISQSIRQVGGAVIEVNACPGIRMHHHPSEGQSRNVAASIVNMLFPAEKPFTIPIFSVTGTNGKTTTTRMLAKILRQNGLVVGMTSTGGIYVQDELICGGDATGPRSAESILLDNRVEVAVLETARGGLINKGLAYDLADIGIITNIGNDHLGMDGVNTLEEMADVKALVTEAIRPQGYAILNAEDKFVERIAQRITCQILYFAKDMNNKVIKDHVNRGEKAVYIKDDIIQVFDGEKEKPVIHVENIPATYGGVLIHNIENSLAAVAAAFGHGIKTDVIAKGLSQFQTDASTNPGRFNIFEMEKCRVVIDYGHNIDGYQKVLEGLKLMKKNRLIGVIGVPGDRTDISTLKIGEISGKHFDHVYIKEDKDLRGRNPGEVANLMKKGCALGGLKEEEIQIEHCEIKALQKALESAQQGDIIIVFYEKLEPLVKLIKDTQDAEKTMSLNPQLEIKIEEAVGKL
ncbi:cyanophycin synthetase [Alkaliphilus metalliredigens QYMF]|uniref:Cyanophycin synthetase n=1 Tax=Alkaliphilus metalliredigens (strain QYMF) TaxID=293826 RepID=A6TML7_ALKMQ|nr:cyanophycin synthetase [Alkaliphilus metalliredigens]ABR47435.1 cyanophycin synthetase [Alkaliphilus metalliredigens QYMF]